MTFSISKNKKQKTKNKKQKAKNDAYKPTFGSTPAIIEKAIASGIKASATTKPDNVSPRILENHSSRKLPKKDVISKLHRVRGKKNNHF